MKELGFLHFLRRSSCHTSDSQSILTEVVSSSGLTTFTQTMGFSYTPARPKLSVLLFVSERPFISGTGHGSGAGVYTDL